MSLEVKIENLISGIVFMYDFSMRQLLKTMALTTAQYILAHPEEFGLQKGNGEIL